MRLADMIEITPGRLLLLDQVIINFSLDSISSKTIAYGRGLVRFGYRPLPAQIGGIAFVGK